MVKLLLILCLIATAGFGADNLDYIGAYSFFNQLIFIFSKIFDELRLDLFSKIKSVYIGGTLSAMLTIVILIYATRKIREGTFEFPKDVIEIIIFLLMITFVNYCLHNYNNLKTVVNYLEIPADTIASAINETTNNILQPKFSQNNRTEINMGTKLEELLKNIYVMQDLMVGSTNNRFFNAVVTIMIKIVIWLIYAWFAFILVASIGMTYILTFLQAEFWKMFGVIMIPLIYFKATRGMVIFWAKTIIALSLISAFMSIMANMSLASETKIIETIGKDERWEIDKGMGMSFVLIGTIIISKIILITFLKEIPTMINGMLGTSAGGSTGAFANSVAMGSIGAAAAGAGFAAFKGAMRGGKVASGGAKTIGTWAKNQGGAANQLNKDVGGGSAGGSGSATSGGSNIGGNISKKTANISTGNSNSSIDSNNWKQGLSNIWNGKAYQHKKPPAK